jgi:hypothetical protein
MKVNDELEMTRKRSWPNLGYYLGVCFEGLKKPTKKPVIIFAWPMKNAAFSFFRKHFVLDSYNECR